jgi:hypothetical protein
VFARGGVKILAMPSHLKKYSIPTVLATGLAALTISACGGSDDSGSSELAKYAPADAPVFVEGAVQPEGDVASNIDALSEKIAGVNLGELIKDGINEDGEVDFDADVKPWLGENAGVFVNVDPASLGSDTDAATDFEDPSASLAEETDSYAMIVESTDTDAAQSFIDKQAESDGATDGEYEGFSYKVADDDGSVVGIVDDYVVIGSSEAEFKAAVDASKGDNLAGTDTFKNLSDHVEDGALLTAFSSNQPYLDAIEQEGADLGGLYSALGIDFENTGTVVSLVPEADEISLKGYSNAGTDLSSGDPSAVIQTFPANSLFATGTGDVGPNATKIMDALNEEGIPGMLKPGDVDKFINEASGQVDVKGIIESLETVAVFVNGNNQRNLGGALVATSSNIEPIESSLRGISSLIGLAGDASVRPLPGGVAGFRVFTPELPGRPIVVGVKDDRLVIGVGLKAAMNALNGSGQTLADTDTYKAADASTEKDGLTMFANPAGIARLVKSLPDESARQAAAILKKFTYMAAGSSDEEGTFEFNIGVQE